MKLIGTLTLAASLVSGMAVGMTNTLSALGNENRGLVSSGKSLGNEGSGFDTGSLFGNKGLGVHRLIGGSGIGK